MAITEADRLDMHLQFRRAMGDKVADTVMEHLPPVGWGDVARTSDINHLGQRIDGVNDRIDDVNDRLRGITAGLWAMGGMTAAGFIGIFTLIATKL